MIRIAKVGIISLTIFSLVIFPTSSVSAGDVLFETVISRFYSWTGASWGNQLNGGFSYVQSNSITYRPSTDQEVCTIRAGLYKSGSPADSVVMSVRVSANNGSPIGGPVIASVTVPADQVSGPPFLPNQTVYTAFSFSPCLNLTSNIRYSFTLTRTQQPSASGNYVSQISNQISYPQTSFWQYVPANGFWQESVGYEPALRLEGPEAPPNKEPVIIVPGILGSRLNRVSDGEEVWVNETSMALSKTDDFLDDLKLNSVGEGVVDISTGEIINSAFGVNQYGNLIQKFKDNGYQLGIDLFLFPYDWRLDIETSSQELDLVVAQALNNSPTGKINIIAHSMGGLLVKDYLMRKGDARVNKLVFVGTPHLGSPKAFNVLNYGDDFDIKLLVFGLNKNKAKDIVQNMSAVYELLPSREYISEAGPYVQDDQVTLDYDQTGQLMASDPLLPDHRNSGLLNIADQFHKSHDSWLPQSASVYNLIGCREYDTIGSFKLDSDGSIDIDSVSGDGTVPLISAEHVPGKNYFVSYPETKINHTGLVSDDRTIDLLYNFIASDSEPTLPVGVSKTSVDCDNVINEVRRLRFSTHSPVNLNVYDSLGNHTGLTSEGKIETNIPDSDFIQVGDNSFVFVPDGTGYSIKINAYATGSFDFKVKELENGQVSGSVVYDDIPINNIELEANFEFTNIASSSHLDVDEEGDGEADIGYSSDGSQILYHDQEAPVIQLTSPTAGEYARSASISVDFSVTDNSGFFYASASFDGFIWVSPSIDLFFSRLGSHSFVVTAQDGAGNKSSESVDFVSIATYESTMSDINRAYKLGWISTIKERDSYLKRIGQAVKIEKRIVKVIEKLPDGSKKEKRIQRLEKKIDRVLAIQFLKDLEKSYNKGQINKEAYSLIKEDILWLLVH